MHGMVAIGCRFVNGGQKNLPGAIIFIARINERACPMFRRMQSAHPCLFSVQEQGRCLVRAPASLDCELVVHGKYNNHPLRVCRQPGQDGGKCNQTANPKTEVTGSERFP